MRFFYSYRLVTTADGHYVYFNINIGVKGEVKKR